MKQRLNSFCCKETENMPGRGCQDKFDLGYPNDQISEMNDLQLGISV